MRPTTSIWIGVRHVGVKDAAPEIKQCAVSEAVMFFATQLRDNTLAQRIDVAIARTEGEVRHRLDQRGAASNTEAFTVPEDFWAQMENELNNLPE